MKTWRVRIRFLLGPAGSGKTFRCISELREALHASAEGPPLLLLAPKQATFQLERQLLADESPPGYTRLRILSFERLAEFVFDRLGRPLPQMLNEEGRLMVLRALLTRRRDSLKLFRASARLAGFAQQLSAVLRELQQNQLTPDFLLKLAAQVRAIPGLSLKLQDLAALLQDYLDWLNARRLLDADCLLNAATDALAGSTQSLPAAGLHVGQLWLDGFAEFSPQEMELLAAVVSRCDDATLAFCLDRVPKENVSWLSHWSVVRRTFEDCRARLETLPGARVSVELLERDSTRSRFQNNPVLQHLEKNWAQPLEFAVYDLRSPEARAKSDSPSHAPGQLQVLSQDPDFDSPSSKLASCIRLFQCATSEAEATLAAREILRFVRAGARFRDAAVMVRKLEGYHDVLRRVFSRYGIPFFLDRREPVAHHPLAELTRSALRTVAFQWAHDDWFAALKTGLAPAEEVEIDRLENEALARGWKGSVWQKPIQLPDQPDLEPSLERLRQRVIPPFQGLALRLAAQQNKPDGPQLAQTLREFWRALDVEEQLEQWANSQAASSEFRVPDSVHATVWEQMNAWLDNVELAFPNEPLGLREWLPILEAGLANLTVGVIPPALDQVLVGSIARSRNPDIQFALVLGLNETLFPAPPETTALLTEADRAELEQQNVFLGLNARQQLSRERYYAYIACTRARRRVVLTCSTFDADDRALNPSPVLSQIRRLFPSLPLETPPRPPDWRDSEHVNELIVPLMRMKTAEDDGENWKRFASLPGLARVIGRLRQFRNPEPDESLSPELAMRLYGATLRTSVSRLEQFAACPFRFFVHSGLRAEERKLFELDVREQGSFQHDVLACFHQQLRDEGKRWRDITPSEARERAGRIAGALMASYRDGLLQASEQTRFLARVMAESLQDFVGTLVGWMRGQYEFDPVAVELPFGDEGGTPAWELDLGNGHRLALHGRIDRVDLCRDAGAGQAFCVVVDYKSSQKQLDPVLVANGLQLQLLAYLNVLRYWPNPAEYFDTRRLVPAGVFYVNLRGKFEREANRADALAEAQRACRLAYRHSGRFDATLLRKLDSRPEATQGDQFNYRLNTDGSVHKGSREALGTNEFKALLDSIEQNLLRMGCEIFSGKADVGPYRKGTVTACDQCDYQAICRIDPWTHRYRALEKEPPGNS